MTHMRGKAAITLVVAALALLSYPLAAQAPVTYERLLNAAKEPHNWLTYGGDYSSNRHSPLTQITPANVKSLSLAWAHQSPLTGSWQATPIVADGIMYLTQRPNDVLALDAATGRVFWVYRYTNDPTLVVCCGSNNRGLAILGETLFMGTLDAHLIALDARSGRPIWKTRVDDSKAGYSITVSPLVVKDKVVIGVGGGEYGIRGFIAAYDAATGKEAWRFYTIPGPGEPGHETWEPCPTNTKTVCDPEAWKHGGGSIWVTGSYDPALNLTYWGVGNAGPDYAHEQRPGDNLYAASVVALDADSGKLRWHYQFTPHDPYDYDSVQVPVLADITFDGKPVKAMLWANRNGLFYVLDRVTGKFLLGKPFVRVNWMNGFDANGRPNPTPQPAGMPTYPAIQGGTNWYSPSVQPAHQADVFLGMGRSGAALRLVADRISGRAQLHRRRESDLRPDGERTDKSDSRSARHSRPYSRTDQQLDRRRGSRCHHGHRPSHRYGQMEVQHDGRQRRRHRHDSN